ncbi:MAG TPA: hypothetical protein VL463_19835 [Kofleriaceae bacterium]|jgi:hypothetical protein|nr:hypothetical protein [Kofleriaceae bacterium]
MRNAIVVALLFAGGRAAADTRANCASLDADAIAVDGMLDDWQGVDRTRIGGGDRDASLDARCAVEAKTLAMSFDVRDEHVVRSAVAVGPGDDLLEIAVAGMTITIAPGLGSIAPLVKIDGKAAPKWIAVETTLQKAGWSAEISIPLAKLRGWKDGTASIDASVSYRDGDVMKAKAPERTLREALTLSLGTDSSEPIASPGDTMKAFLASTGLSKTDVTLDATAELDRSSKGSEHVVAGRRIIGLLGDKFTYVQLPADRDADVIAKPKLADLRGDGSRVVIAVVREAGGQGTRDVLLGFGAKGGSIVQLFAVEVRRERNGSKLESDWSIHPGRKPQLVVRAKPAVNWDADTYDEGPSGDAEPIALPWDDDRWGAAYTLDGDALNAHPLPGKRTTK